MKLIVSGAVYIPLGSNMDILDGGRERHLDHNRILSQQGVDYEIMFEIMHQNIYARATSSQIGHLNRDGRIRSAPLSGPGRDNPVQTYLIVSEGETRSWQIVSSKIGQSWSYHDHIASKGNKSYQNISTCITSY